MNQTNLQIPIDAKICDKAKRAAKKQGFSSLQEMVRVFLAQVIDERLMAGFFQQNIALSKDAQKRYENLLAEKSEGKASASVDLLMNELDA